MAARLFKYFSPPDADGEVVMTGAVALFMSYPQSVVEAAVDPVNGLPSQLKWAPKLSEIKEFCEQKMEPIRRQRERDYIAAEAAKALPAPDDRSTRPTYDELAKRCADAGFPIGPKRKSALSLAEQHTFRDKFQITQEQWDAIPSQADDRSNRDRQGLA